MIPDTLDGQQVKGIRSGVFSSQQIQSLQLPPIMEFIGINAFSNNALTSLNLSNLNALTTIGESVFANQSDDDGNGDSLTRFVLPPQVDRVVFETNTLVDATITLNKKTLTGDTVVFDSLVAGRYGLRPFLNGM